MKYRNYINFSYKSFHKDILPKDLQIQTKGVIFKKMSRIFEIDEPKKNIP